MARDWIGGRRRVRAAGAFTLAVGLALVAAPAAAHGDVTGARDLIQDYGVLLFLIAVVLVGAGVVTWVALAPEPTPEGEADDAADGRPG